MGPVVHDSKIQGHSLKIHKNSLLFSVLLPWTPCPYFCILLLQLHRTSFLHNQGLLACTKVTSKLSLSPPKEPSLSRGIFFSKNSHFFCLCETPSPLSSTSFCLGFLVPYTTTILLLLPSNGHQCQPSPTSPHSQRAVFISSQRKSRSSYS